MNTLTRRATWRAWPLTKLNVPVKIIGGRPGPPHATALQKQKEYRCFVFTSSIKGEIREFHVLVEQWRQRKIYRNTNLNLLLFCRSRWRRHCRCVASVIVTIEHRHRLLFMYTFLGHVNTNPDTLKLNTSYLRLLEFGVVYPVWIHPLPHLFQSSTRIQQTRRIQKKSILESGFKNMQFRFADSLIL